MLFEELRYFLDEFFNEDTYPLSPNSEFRIKLDNNKKHSSHSKEVKAIPGGRYGCAQFLKMCGPEPISSLSLGKLA